MGAREACLIRAARATGQLYLLFRAILVTLLGVGLVDARLFFAVVRSVERAGGALLHAAMGLGAGLGLG